MTEVLLFVKMSLITGKGPIKLHRKCGRVVDMNGYLLIDGPGELCQIRDNLDKK